MFAGFCITYISSKCVSTPMARSTAITFMVSARQGMVIERICRILPAPSISADSYSAGSMPVIATAYSRAK